MNRTWTWKEVQAYLAIWYITGMWLDQKHDTIINLSRFTFWYITLDIYPLTCVQYGFWHCCMLREIPPRAPSQNGTVARLATFLHLGCPLCLYDHHSQIQPSQRIRLRRRPSTFVLANQVLKRLRVLPLKWSVTAQVPSIFRRVLIWPPRPEGREMESSSFDNTMNWLNLSFESFLAIESLHFSDSKWQQSYPKEWARKVGVQFQANILNSAEG